MFRPLSHFSVISQFIAEIYASTPISPSPRRPAVCGRLPVILLLKSSHIPIPKTNIYRWRTCFLCFLLNSQLHYWSTGSNEDICPYVFSSGQDNMSQFSQSLFSLGHCSLVLFFSGLSNMLFLILLSIFVFCESICLLSYSRLFCSLISGRSLLTMESFPGN